MESDVRGFWDRRHATQADLRSGGDLGLSEIENLHFYETRFGQILGLLEKHGLLQPGGRLLDAGCGKGWFCDRFAGLGLHVCGVDASPTAIGMGNARHPGRFHCIPLDQLRLAPSFDIVMCVDVLFHLLDDEVWARSLRGLCRAVSSTGALVFSDDLRAEPFVLGSYIIHRSRGQYDDLLSSEGFRLAESLPFVTRGNPNHFYLYRYLD